MELGTSQMTSLAKSTYSLLQKAYQARQEHRLKEFLHCIDLRYETMTTEDQEKLNERINSAEGEALLAEYADTITKTSSSRARMAIALLYCEDPELSFDKSEKITFISAMNGMNDDLMDFFLMAMKLDVKKEGLPYPRSGIHHQNADIFFENEWDEEAIFVYINDLIRTRLLLPDPRTFSAVAGDGQGWAVWFGVTERSRKFSALISKAEALLLET